MSAPESPNNDPVDAEGLPSISSASLDRLSSFLLAFGAITLFVSFYLIPVQFVEEFLQLHFERVVADAIRIDADGRPPGARIRQNLIERVDGSEWVGFWGARVDVAVLAADGATFLYVNGFVPAPRFPGGNRQARDAFFRQQLPARATVRASIDQNSMISNSILAVSALLLLMGLFLFNRHVARLQDRELDTARESRDLAASKARRIEKELDLVRGELREVEPANQEHREEIARLQSEQRGLQAELRALAVQERELRHQAKRAGTLEDDSRALEELLEEATRDLDSKNAKIFELEKRLSREAKTGAAGGSSKERGVLERRLRSIYPNVEIDDRAIDDLMDIRDESAMLRAEECIKRLNDDADNVPIRRKVTGLPSHLSILEIGFAGKRRIYVARVANGRYRVLVVGAKNTQQTDLDYLARIPKGKLT